MYTKAYTAFDYARPLADDLRAAGYRVRVFARKGNPLDWDSKVRPKRTPGKCEMLARVSEGRTTGWVWVECDESQIMDVHAIAHKNHERFVTVGYPRP